MTSNQSSISQSGGKSPAISTSQSTNQFPHPYINSPSVDVNSRRSNSNTSSPPVFARHNQTLRKQHKNQRKPRLADEDAIAETGAMRNSNGRRGQTSITHLMNFTLPPRPQYSTTAHRGTRRNPTYGLGSGHHASDKARYIHANYRFVVNPKGDYHNQVADADIHLDWTNVLQILASTESQSSSCPICLSHPVGPRMAKCGHIFCLPCLIRYMHSTDDANPVPEKKARWKKCPICWDSVYISDTKPVRWYTGQEGPAPREGDDIVLRLVMRLSGNTLALPRDGADVLTKSDDVPWFFAADVMDYARVMKGTEDYMLSQFDAEIEELERQDREDELMFGEETEWTKKAVSAVREAKERIRGIGGPPALVPKSKERKLGRTLLNIGANVGNSLEDRPSVQTLERRSPAQSSEGEELSGTNSKSHDEATITTTRSMSAMTLDAVGPPARPERQRLSVVESPRSDLPFFFYQALLHYYLSPLDIRILKSAFGDFVRFPSTLLPRVERVSTGHIMDDDLRKRTKYLAHLPHGCEVGFLECDWTDVVEPEILRGFQEEIDRRRKRNKDKETREEKDRVRAERLEDSERWAAARRKRSILPDDDFAGLDMGHVTQHSLDAAVASPPWGARQGSSFASLASPSTSPSTPRTVWGTNAVIPGSPDLLAVQSSEADGDDGWLQDWEKELMAENELIAQVQAASMNGESSSAAPTTPITSAGRKKKGKKITLMSTTARRAA